MKHTIQKLASVISLGIMLSLGNNSAVMAQSSSYCPNADFEMGDFTNWLGYTGVFSQLPNVPTPGIVAGRHTIISTPALDPFTCNNLQVLPAVAGNYVCRLGNSSVGAQTERLVYSLAVDSNNALFVYRYAVVLEDPGHTPAQQPRFQIRVLDTLGNLVDPVCGQYFVQSGANIPGFQFCASESVVWKDWTTVGVSLVNYIGQTILLEFTTADCSLSGHFGYAYLEAYCMPMAIQSEFCIGANAVNLLAPPGFSSYLWSTGDTTINATVLNPVIGQQVTCTLTTVQNCSLVLTTTLNSTIITPSYTVQIDQCNPSAPVQFTDATTIVNGNLAAWAWDFDDSSPLDTNQNPSHTFPGPGSYQVKLYAYSISGCVDSVTTTVEIFTPPTSAFSNNDACLGDATIFADLSTAGNDTVVSWAWDFGDSFSDNVQNPQHTYSSAATYPVVLIVTTNNGCTDTLNQNVVVNPLPVITTTPATSICVGDVTVMAASGATTYEWSPANALSATTGSSVSANPVATEIYTVVGTDGNGCSSSASITITVNPLPLVVTPADPEVCLGDCQTLNLSGAFTYSWLNSSYITSSNPDSSVVDVCPAATTIYTVIGSSQEGCTASVTFDVDVHPNPAPVISPDGATTFCEGNSVNLFVTPFNTGDQPQWSNGDMDDSVHVVASGTFTVTVTDVNGCQGTSPSLSVTVNPSPVAAITPVGPVTICTGFPATLYAATGPGYTYEWYRDNILITDSTGETLLVTATGIYSVHVTANNCTSISNDVSVILGLGPDVTITASPTIGCLQNTIYIGYGPQSVTLTANATPSAASYLWFPDSQVTQSISVTQPGAYSVIAFDANGCPSPNPAVLTPAINVIDIRCGQGNKKIILCHVPEGNPGNPQTICVGPPSIPHHLALHQYDCLGPCSLYYPRLSPPVIEGEGDDFFVLTYPNPFNTGFNLYILSAYNDEVRVNIYDVVGRIVETYRNVTEETLIGTTLTEGVYNAEIVQGENRKMISIIKSR